MNQNIKNTIETLVSQSLYPSLRRGLLGFVVILGIVFMATFISLVFLNPIISLLLWLSSVGLGHFMHILTLILGCLVYACFISAFVISMVCGIPWKRCVKKVYRKIPKLSR